MHPINAEGVLVLFPLTGSENEIIREGVSAMLAQRHEEAEALAREHQQQGWTTYQISDRLVLDRLRAASETCSMSMFQNRIIPIVINIIAGMAIAAIVAVRRPAMKTNTTTTTAMDEITLDATSATFLSTVTG